jgi:hypothetical protein
MGLRVARLAAIAVLVAVMAITPLSVAFSAGRFETLLPARDFSRAASAHITLDDQTGMVRAISPARPADLDTVANPGGDRYWLVATWGDTSCLREAHLGLRASAGGWVLEQRTVARSCGFLDLRYYAVAIHLWAPIDATAVTFIPSE